MRLRPRAASCCRRVMDYALPRADILPSFSDRAERSAGADQPLGVRAGGEGGTTPALAAVINAIVDALAEFGVTISRCRRRPSASGARSRPRDLRASPEH